MRNSCIYKNVPITFRRSSTMFLGSRGSNMQNWAKHLREIYRPDGFTPALTEKCLWWLETGDVKQFTELELLTLRVFVQSDQSGAEALIVAYESDALDYRQLFINSVKPHVYVALKLFKDIWTRKLKESGGLIEDFNIDELCQTSIPLLKKNPFWKDIDSLIKSSDNWSAQERYYYLAKQTCHCLSSDTEVLTPNGWLGVDKIKLGDSLAIYNKGSISFEISSVWSVADYQGDMILLAGEETNQLVTPNHRVVYNSNKKEHVSTANCVMNLNDPRIPTCGLYNGGNQNLKDWEVKLLVAIQADGHLQSDNIVRFNFAKDRKIDRLFDIIKEGNLYHTFIPYNSVTSAGSLVSVVSITCPDIIKLFKGKKQWDSWLLNLSTNNLSLMIDELKYWDGTYTESYLHSREEYCSSIHSNLEWMKTVCHLVNKQGTINGHKMGINVRRLSRIHTKKRVQYNGKIYCPTVSSGMFLIRRNGVITITGNSANYGIEAQTFRQNILEKSEGIIYLETKAAAEFLLTYRSLFPEIPERCRRIEQQVQKTKMLFNLFGHPFQITDYNIEQKLKEYYAWSAQSTVGEITRKAITNLQMYIQDCHKQWDILADTHDSDLTQGSLLDVGDRMVKMKDFMNIEMVSPIDGTKFRMKSEQAVGFNWNSRKESNPLGLGELKWL